VREEDFLLLVDFVDAFSVALLALRSNATNYVGETDCDESRDNTAPRMSDQMHTLLARFQPFRPVTVEGIF
jgi:hypothetical protein